MHFSLFRLTTSRSIQPRTFQRATPILTASLLLATVTYIGGAPGLFKVYAADLNSQPVGTDQTLTSELPDGWQLMRSPNPKGGDDAVSIGHAADTSRSDLELVGLMVRCSEKDPQALIVVLSALQASTRPDVHLGILGDEADFQATVVAPGTLVLLPDQATKMLSQGGQGEDLVVRVDNSGSTIAGAIKLAGFAAAFEKLQSACPKH